MKRLATLFGLLAAPFLHGATLVWEASSTTNGAAPPAFYRAYSSPVVALTNAVWNLYGTSTSTNLLITNNVFLMFHIKAVSSAGTESDPSNVATNNFSTPNPPGKLIITGQLEDAPTINGPWTPTKTNGVPVNFVAEIPASSNQFFRTQMAIASTVPASAAVLMVPRLERPTFTPPPLPR